MKEYIQLLLKKYKDLYEDDETKWIEGYEDACKDILDKLNNIQ